ncbi:MAG TPA: DNA primase [Gemmatimonadales bacterium]|jgi:DNA primase|nr:DNA primase [Gemmatimonadales bacterium]
MIPDEIIEQVRDSADLIGIVSESVPLKRTGADWRGPCPFHGGTHRNFAVIPRKGMFYCYVCHEAGDVFTYLMKRFGMDYPSAVRDVARRVGITIPERQRNDGPDPNEPLYTAASAAQDWFTRQLLDDDGGAPARRYLDGRGISPETAGELGLGFSPRGQAFLEAMHTLGIEDSTLMAAGLAGKREDGTVTAKFWNRVMFPIHDLRGRVVAFGGRTMGDGEPKYLNSPESAIFHKGRMLYHLHAARHAIRKEEAALVVEGYFDVIQLALNGIEHVVAPLGTALTPDQASLLRRFTQQVTLLYDSDAAGLRATFRAADELLRQSVRVRIATMPAGEDPDTMMRQGGAAVVNRVVADAVDVLERKIQLLAEKGWFEDLERRRSALDRLLPTIRAAADPITRQLYLSRVAERSGVSKDVLERELRFAPSHQATGPSRGTGHPGDNRGEAPTPVRGAEWDLLRVLVAAPAFRGRAVELVPADAFELPEHRELFQAISADASLADQPPEQLSHRAQLLWSRLRESAAELEGANFDDMFTTTAEMIISGPEWRAIQTLTDPVERRRRVDDFKLRYPLAGPARDFQRRARRNG